MIVKFAKHGESLDKYITGLKSFVSEVQEKYYDKKVLAVAHNGIISVISCILE